MVYPVGLHIEVCHHVDNDGRVDAAAAGAHDGAFQGGKPHAGVDAPAVFHGGDAAAVPQVAGNQFELGRRSIQTGGRFSGNELMARAMESIPSDTVVFVQGIGQAVQIGMLGQGGMKGRVEDGHMGDAREKRFAGLDTLQVGWVVEGGQLTVFSNDLFDGIIDDGRCRDGLPSMNDPVADGGNRLICFDDTNSSWVRRPMSSATASWTVSPCAGRRWISPRLFRYSNPAD